MTDEIEGIVYVGEDGEPEVTPESKDAHLEEKVVDLPDVMMASDLLQEDDPLSEIPAEPPDAETPPDDTAPPFIIERNKYGPGVHSIRLPTGMPVGRWLEQEHNDLDGVGVAELLVEMGMESELAVWFGNVRSGRIDADLQLARDPNVKTAIQQEDVRLKQKAAVQAAFIKAQKEKAKKS